MGIDRDPSASLDPSPDDSDGAASMNSWPTSTTETVVVGDLPKSSERAIHDQRKIRGRRKKDPQQALIFQDDASFDSEPLIDTTAALTLNSKKTARLQKKLQRKDAKRVHSSVQSFLDLPHELLVEVLSHLEPTDIFTLALTSRSTHHLIQTHESTIASAIISRRYWVLSRCFRLPVPLSSLPEHTLPALLSPAWQDRLRIHKSPYSQIVAPIDALQICTCMSCVLAWNNLNILLDLAHFQPHLDNREPLPIIPRGTRPEWNTELLETHARIVTRAVTSSPLTYARTLQTHLHTTTATILRTAARNNQIFKPKPRAHIHKPAETLSRPTPKPRLYHLTDIEAASGSDEFLERSGPPSYQPPYMRDNYYNLEAFVPNRKWDKIEEKWVYYAKGRGMHEGDLAWVVGRFMPEGSELIGGGR